MLRKERVCFESVLDHILDDNESDCGDLSSDDDDNDGDDDSDYEEPDDDNINDEQPLATSTKEAQTSTKEADNGFRWRKRDISSTPVTCEPVVDEVEVIMSPLEYFKTFWNDELTELVVEQTNLYSTQKTTSSESTTTEEIEKFIGMHMKMGVMRLPSYKMYWSQQMRYPAIADIMPLKRYVKLRSSLHFVDNNPHQPGVSSKLFSIQPVIDHVREQFRKVSPEECHSVDEQIIPAKTRYSGIRQYNPKKPTKWMFKNLVRAGTSGFMYDFYIYSGKDEGNEEETSDFSHLLKSSQVVAKLCQNLPNNAGYKLYFDNWFTSLELLIYLKNKGILATGTIRADRTKKCPLKTKQELKKEGRGSLDYKLDTNSDLVLVKWLDNSVVHIASNYCGVEPLGTVKRWCSEARKKTDFPCPYLILCYNKGMGGVDFADMMIALYRIHVKTRRWYVKVFWHLVDMVKVNAWVLYNRHCDILAIPKKQQLSLVDFTLTIAEALVHANKIALPASNGKPGRPKKRQGSDTQSPSCSSSKVGRKPTIPAPCDDSRFDKLGHWPEPTDKRGRCRNCKDGFSKVFCTKCNICLCMRKEKNCFMEYHHK